MAVNIYNLPDETQRADLSAVDAAGNEFELQGIVLRVVIPEEHVQELLAAYDSSSATSPVVAYSRPLARAALDALQAYMVSRQLP